MGRLVARDVQTDALARYGHSGAGEGAQFVNGRLEATRLDGPEVFDGIEAPDLVLKLGFGSGHFRISSDGARTFGHAAGFVPTDVPRDGRGPGGGFLPRLMPGRELSFDFGLYRRGTADIERDRAV